MIGIFPGDDAGGQIVPNCAICKKPVDSVEYARNESIRGWHYIVRCHGDKQEFDLGDRFVLDSMRGTVQIGEAFEGRMLDGPDGRSLGVNVIGRLPSPDD